MAAWLPGTRIIRTGQEQRLLAHLTCWIGLDDSTRENGCLHYVPGSHKWPDLPKPVLAGEMDGIRDILPEKLKDKFAPVAIELKKGESSFHHARTMHGSRANNTPAPRRATVINVFRDGVLSNSDEPLLEGVPVIPRGDRMGGQFFPLLFDPQSLPVKVIRAGTDQRKSTNVNPGP
jgi:ectoine hydroxylase-related dioxygenase (phytanoyl-CoA dioxygenase family)